MHRWKGEHRGENARFAPSIKLPEGLGEVYLPSLFRGVQRGFPSGKPGRQRSAKLVWQSRAQPWQDKPRRGGVRWIQKNPSYIACMEDEQKDDVSIFFRDTLGKQIEAVVDTITPLYGDDLHKRTVSSALVFV